MEYTMFNPENAPRRGSNLSIGVLLISINEKSGQVKKKVYGH